MFSCVLPPNPFSAATRSSSMAATSSVDRGDAQLPVEHHRLLRAEAGDRHQLAHPRRDLRPQRLEVRERPGPLDLDDLLPDRLPDVRDLQDPLQDRAPTHRRDSRPRNARPSRRRAACTGRRSGSTADPRTRGGACSTSSFARATPAASGQVEQHEQERLLRVEPVLRLVPHGRARAVDDLGA